MKIDNGGVQFNRELTRKCILLNLTLGKLDVKFHPLLEPSKITQKFAHLFEALIAKEFYQITIFHEQAL